VSARKLLVDALREQIGAEADRLDHPENDGSDIEIEVNPDPVLAAACPIGPSARRGTLMAEGDSTHQGKNEIIIVKRRGG